MKKILLTALCLSLTPVFSHAMNDIEGAIFDHLTMSCNIDEATAQKAAKEMSDILSKTFKGKPKYKEQFFMLEVAWADFPEYKKTLDEVYTLEKAIFDELTIACNVEEPTAKESADEMASIIFGSFEGTPKHKEEYLLFKTAWTHTFPDYAKILNDIYK